MQPLHINGVAVELETSLDWRGQVVYVATVGGVRRRFNTAHWAVEWAIQAIDAIRRGVV